MVSSNAFPLQMGGKEGVLKSQSVALSTLQPEGGLWVHCIPRSLQSGQLGVHRIAGIGLPKVPRPGSSGQLEALPEHPDAPCTSRLSETSCAQTITDVACHVSIALYGSSHACRKFVQS